MILKKGPFKYVKHDCSIYLFDKKIKPYPNVVSQTSYKIYFSSTEEKTIMQVSI